jgi:hypothetical protein
MARTIPGAIWEFVRYEVVSRVRGHLILILETDPLDDEAFGALLEAFVREFPSRTSYTASGDHDGTWSVEAHVPPADAPVETRRRLATWAEAHRPPIRQFVIRQRSLRGTA